MFVERHDLHDEFPEHKELIDTLLSFSLAYREYDALDKEIMKIEQNVKPCTDAYCEELKMKRVHLKDHLYGILESHNSES
ncbi:MAG: YdcH family protein [Pseudomonadota bacterium]|nr:YdcH family protein [Pseudomonadota bacterium]